MPIESLNELSAFSVSSIWNTSMASLEYTGFVEPKKYDSNAERVDDSGSRSSTRILPGVPPTSFQSVIWPVKIFAT